jgi:sulfur carrier protein
MQIILNGAAREVSARADLASALAELGFADAVVATALNGHFVPSGARSATFLTAGDQLEVLAPMQGG